MPFYDPLAAQFANRPLDAWQVSKKNFDFEMGFVGWIQKYLETRKLPCDVVSAKAWINKTKFDGERYELCQLQWEAYQESLKPPERPSIKPVVLNSVLRSGDLDGASESAVDGAEPEVGDHPPNLPDFLRRKEGETVAEQNDRIRDWVKSKLPAFGGKMDFVGKKQ